MNICSVIKKPINLICIQYNYSIIGYPCLPKTVIQHRSSRLFIKTLNIVDGKSEQRGPRSKKGVILCIARCLFSYVSLGVKIEHLCIEQNDLLKSLTIVFFEESQNKIYLGGSVKRRLLQTLLLHTALLTSECVN